MREVREVWKEEIYYNNGARNARGVAMMIRKDKIENIKEVYRDHVGRILAIEFRYKGV